MCLLRGGGGARAGDEVAQILNRRSSEGTLLQVDGEAVEVAELTKMMLMKGLRVGENQYIVK